MLRRTLVGLVAIVALCILPAASEARQNRRAINSTQVGSTWPFTVSAGELACIPPGSNVVFIAGGKRYALNGRAKGNAASLGLSDSAAVIATSALGDPKQVVSRIPEAGRKEFFEKTVECEDRFPSGAARTNCQSAAGKKWTLTAKETTLITSEGLTLGWPPLSPVRKDVAPMIQIGLGLCK